MVHRVSVDLRRNGILKRQTDELNAVFPSQTFFHQLSLSPDDVAFTSAGKSVTYVSAEPHNDQNHGRWLLWYIGMASLILQHIC